tara:strand:+ start:1464 stop:3068 length:1605 start_codon:yes stop_codon:yes gene_type:complete
MRYFLSFLILISSLFVNAQSVLDDFEGSGTITSWVGDACGIDVSFTNPHQESINTSNTVLRYGDSGGLYANVRFDVSPYFNLLETNTFSFKIYVPSSGLTGSQENKVSLKLQNNNLGTPWITQCEIIKPLVLNQWQEIVFNYETDFYLNFDSESGPPIYRSDLNRVVIQVNGENNNDQVVAYIDDITHLDTENNDPVYDNLVWSDEFDGTGSINNSNWHHQTQLIDGNSWANGELQHYTNRQANSYVSNGTLKIKAKLETYANQGVTKNYTSARLNSKFAFRYGRVEVRAKLASVAGTWPAIWMLGKNINENGAYWDNLGYGTSSWPSCGEIDIMEPNIEKTRVLATWHWDNGSGYQYNGNHINTTNADTSQNFHDYVLVWTPDSMKIYMDSNLVNQMNVVTPFDTDFFILLNVAMGGDLGGTIASNFNEDILEIDYVRVYQESPLGIADLESNFKISSYPNPVSNLLNIKISNVQNQTAFLSLYDLTGRLISNTESSIRDQKISYNTSSLVTGVYFVSVKLSNGRQAIIKFIK